MFNWVPDKQVQAVIISEDGGPVTSVNGVTFEAQYSFANAPALDVLWTSGRPARRDERHLMTAQPPTYLDYLQQVGGDGKLGLLGLRGRAAARPGRTARRPSGDHPLVRRQLPGAIRKVEVVSGYPRFVQSGNRLTGGGISSGLDEALRLIEILAGTGTAMDVQTTHPIFPDPARAGKYPLAPAGLHL